MAGDRERYRQLIWRAGGATLLLLLVAVRLASVLVRRVDAEGWTVTYAVLGAVGVVAIAAVTWFFVVPMWREAHAARTR